MSPPTKVLFLGSSPSDADDAALTQEFDQIAKALAAGAHPFTLVPKFEAQARDLPGLIMTEAPAILHFSGHGDEHGKLIFQDKNGRSSPADAAAIAEVFEVLGDTVRCVVLNACFTLHQAQEIAKHIDAVVGMRKALGVAQAIAFSRGFYEALANARSVETAFRLAKLAIDLDNLPADAEPELLTRPGRESGELFLASDSPSNPAAFFEADDPIAPTELAHYMNKAEAMHERVRLLGFTTTTRLSMRLDELYVSLDAVLDHDSPGRDINTAAELEHCHERLPLDQVFERARQLGRRGLVLLGNPGSGKTTHLARVLLKVVRQGAESVGLPRGTVPVFLPLQALRDRAAGLPGFIQAQLRDPLLDMAPDFGKRLCKRHKLLLLLDGLDEVADADERAEVSRWIEQILDASKDNYVLVSCRYAGYKGRVELEGRFLELHLRPLDDDQMRCFVTNWYGLVERERGGDLSQIVLRAERGAKELLSVLESTAFTAIARVYELTRNPLLLTAICLVHHDHGRLPHARAKLYQQSIAVLLERWRESRPETVLFADTDEALELLQPVAAWMHGERGRRRASKAELLGPVTQAMARLPGVDFDAEHFLTVIRDESGLLTGWGVDEYGFMHLGFQEFLTAQHLHDEGLRDPRVFAELAARFDDGWWREVISLMLALRHPPVFEPFMEALVQQRGFARWWNSELMQQCFSEAASASGVPFVALLRQVDDRGWVARLLGRGAERAEELGRRQLAAAKVLARELPEQLEEMAGLLDEHPVPAVRQWWRTGARVESGGEVILAPRGGVELVYIPSGRFMMGSAGNEEGRFENEGPQHEVELESFYLARTPVTNEQYAEYLEAHPKAAKPEYWADRKYNQPQQPVVGVSWDEAKAYCDWAGLVLPTEAQWEYACRAETETRYWSGDDEEDLARVGWYGKNSGGELHAVGEKETNPWGLYDMHGNVFEWCLDAWGDYTTSPRPVDGLRHEPVGDGHRVFRGGSWYYPAHSARSACRFLWRPAFRNRNVGFRPAQGIP